MSAPGARKQGAGEGRLAGIAGWLERSQRVFLAGLVAAVAVEVVVDWNSTFYDVGVLRSRLRDKASHYAAVLRLAAEDPLARSDEPRLEELARRVLEDDEVAAVVFFDAAGRPASLRGASLQVKWPKQLQRDVRGILADPGGLRERIASSRHKDVFQAVADREDRMLFKIGVGDPPGSQAPGGPMVAYQDRLYDEATRVEDRTITWALARVGDGPEPRGALVVAMRTDRLRHDMDRRLLKGTLVTLFFLAVILVQQLAGRRAKLRMIAMRDALAAARTALRAALPTAPPPLDGLDGALAFEQAERIGGTTFALRTDPAAPGQLDLFLAEPDGSGVDVAFASVFVRDLERRQRAAGDPSPEPLFRRLAAAYRDAPIQRPLKLALYRIDLARGELAGVSAGLDPPLVLASGGAAIAPERSPLDAEVDGALIEGPIERIRIALPQGATLVAYSDGLPPGAPRPLDPARLAAEARAHLASGPGPLVAHLRRVALKHAHVLQDDLFLLALHRKLTE